MSSSRDGTEGGSEQGNHSKESGQAAGEQAAPLMLSQYQQDFPPPPCPRRRTPALPHPDNIGINPAFRWEWVWCRHFSVVKMTWKSFVFGSQVRVQHSAERRVPCLAHPGSQAQHQLIRRTEIHKGLTVGFNICELISRCKWHFCNK